MYMLLILILLLLPHCVWFAWVYYLISRQLRFTQVWEREPLTLPLPVVRAVARPVVKVRTGALLRAYLNTQKEHRYV